jgi:hypothetical protein
MFPWGEIRLLEVFTGGRVRIDTLLIIVFPLLLNQVYETSLVLAQVYPKMPTQLLQID